MMLRGSAALLLLLAACADGFAPLSVAPAPLEVKATAVKVDAVRLTWQPVSDESVVAYTIERRADFSGKFVEVAQVPQSNLGAEFWIDTDVQPETFYGYRVRSVTAVGDRSEPSVISGALTPPLPGIEITTNSIVTSTLALDPDGYEVLIAGLDTIRASIGVQTTRRFSPLRPGTYTVTLSGIISRCSVNGSVSQQVVVTDTSAITIAPIGFQLSCRDPNRGDIAVALSVTGAERDPEFTLDVLGEASDATLPPAERVFSTTRGISTANPETRFTNLRPGTYDVTIADIAANCTLQGTATRTVTVTALGVASVNFAISCVGSGPPPSTAPFVWRNTWAPATAGNGASVTLELSLDLTPTPSQRVQGVQASVFYDPAVLRFEEEIAQQLPIITVNGNVPGQISFIASNTSARAGLVRLADFRFTVIGTAGATTSTTTQNVKAGSPVAFQDSIRVVEDTFVVVTGGGGSGVNAAPTAEANGPYTSTAGSPITFSSNGSGDTDGTIASYAWAFGDGTTGVGPSPSKTYATPGTYTVTLTVTDDDGATGTDQATVTIGSSGGGNTPPIARANGPYSGVAGTPLTLSSAGSSDANGTIVSYAWTLGNGQTASGATPTVTYATAGSYIATLTVADNQGATATSQATVTITAPPSALPLTWSNTFGPLDVNNNLVAITISYDMRTNIIETPSVEALQTFTLDSLTWDSTVLQFHSVSLGPNIIGTSNQTGVGAGRTGLNGTISGAQQQGLITIATVRFRPVGASGRSTITRTYLGPLIGPSSTNFYVYNSKTALVEGEFRVP
jgi:PKD repeat protein